MRQAIAAICVFFAVLVVMAQAIETSCSKDVHTLANCDQFTTRHIFMNLTVDFETQRLSGYVDLYIKPLAASQQVIVDTRKLTVLAVYLVEGSSKTPLPFSLETPSQLLPVYGSGLVMNLPRVFSSEFVVRVYYFAGNQSEAIQFMKPSQTAGKNYPYLFTQNEAVHARSMLPCMDTPSAKTTYSAQINVPAPLTAVMSAALVSSGHSGNFNTFVYNQTIPIPTYLIALAVGNLKSGKIGPRSSVWSEPEMIDAGTYEFAETETFIAKAESFLIPYKWGTYDVLLLPPSFPFGGMENPMLTFATPTLLAGDRSLANVIAHEIAHSWSGNLVTNVNWEHFWLNEGFTVYIERRITARVKGEPEAALEALIGLNGLQADIKNYNESGQLALTRLVQKLYNVDPDDSFSSVPYEKGFNFLYYLASLVTTERFEEFLKAYFTKFAYQVLDSYQMKSYFEQYFTGKVPSSVLAQIEWDQWFYTEGMPYKQNTFDTSLADAATALANLWITNPQEAATHAEYKTWSSNQRQYFLDVLGKNADQLSIAVLQQLDQAYGLTQTKNSEQTFRWLQLCLQKNWSDMYQHVVDFITAQGRLKFVRPLYRGLFRAAGGKELAVSTFLKYRDMYHPLTSKMIAQDLGLGTRTVIFNA